MRTRIKEGEGGRKWRDRQRMHGDRMCMCVGVLIGGGSKQAVTYCKREGACS